MAWSPGEYGTATSISIFSKYFRLLLKRRPPRDMSSHATTSSASPGRRTHALKLTRVRTCFRRFSRSFSFTARPGLEVAALGDSDCAGSATSPAVKIPSSRLLDERPEVAGSTVAAFVDVSGPIPAAPAKHLVRYSACLSLTCLF